MILRKPILAVLAVAALAGWGGGRLRLFAAGPGGSAGLGDAEFETLREELHVKNQPWAAVPWKVSVTEARRVAAETKKPIFLVVNTGNCLGFV